MKINRSDRPSQPPRVKHFDINVEPFTKSYDYRFEPSLEDKVETPEENPFKTRL